jgi:hypothetical protein
MKPISSASTSDGSLACSEEFAEEVARPKLEQGTGKIHAAYELHMPSLY